ncbi:MAG TPA: carboxypeptidase-like regulatory domain-containing protein [Chloroflexia bacterium]|nr:carboxypeptidase-like regulatory domain-containing protein [Chloroflexia bacterium]
MTNLKAHKTELKSGRAHKLILCAICIAVSYSMTAPANRVRAEAAAQSGDSYTFPETGKSVSGTFLQYWQSHGGLAQQGYPVSDEMQEENDTDGNLYTVQYFERAVFELHPENQPPYDVLLSLLGSLAYKQAYPSGRASGEVANPTEGQAGTCSATHDDSDAGEGAGFDPEAPQRETVGAAHTVTGVVLSSESCLPVANAKLEMRPEVGGVHPESQRATLYTDADGHYVYKSDQPEHIHMRISAHGFRTIVANQYHPAPDQSTGRFDIVLVPDPACRLFKETGQSLCGTFLDYWQQHGGLTQQGYPISDEHLEKSGLDGRIYTVQYFERAVFEAHPENDAPYDILLSQLGTIRYKVKYLGGVSTIPRVTQLL